MHDLETKTERSHEMRGKDLVVIRKQIGMNGSKREVTVITEEKGITSKEVKEVLEEAVPREVEKVDRDISKLEGEIKDLENQIKEFENTREFKEFEKFINRPNTKELFEKLNKKDMKGKLDKQLEHLLDQRQDILDWKKQFESIAITLNK